MTPADLVTTWRNRARELEPYAAPAAVAYAKAADELEEALATSGEVVALNEAAQRCGYSPDHLGRLVKSGKLSNHGTRRRPLVRVADLPRKPQLTRRDQLAIVRAQ